ncbi:MAG: hypothetical protein PVI04_01660 [Anaerolineales bacterium]
MTEQKSNAEDIDLVHSTTRDALKRYAKLRPRDRGLLRHLAELLRNCDIDGYQAITEATSRMRLENIQRELEVNSIEEAVEYAERHELFRRWRQTRLW